MVRSITSQPISFSRLRACDGEISWSTSTMSARRVSGSASDLRRLLGTGRPALRRRPRVGRMPPSQSGSSSGSGSFSTKRRISCRLPIAQVGRRIEMVALLRERAHDLETQRLGQFAQLVHRGVELDVAHPGELHRGHDGAQRFLLAFWSHRATAVFKARPVFSRGDRAPHSHSIVAGGLPEMS